MIYKYDNIIPEEMVYRPVNYLTQEIDKAFSCDDASPYQLRNVVYNAVDILYREDSNSKTITRCLKGTSMKILIRAFKYNARWYYWWDLVDGNEQWIAAGLEFYPFVDDKASFVLFATRIGQSPFIWRENIRF